MEEQKSFIDKNLLISFIISISYIIFIYFFTLPPSEESYNKKTSINLKNLNTPYKLLYLVNNNIYSKNYNVNNFRLETELPAGTTSYKGLSAEKQMLVYFNQCDFDVDVDQNLVSLYLRPISYDQAYQPIDFSFYKSGSVSIPVLKLEDDSNEVYSYDFVTNTRTKLNCSGKFNLSSRGSRISPDKKVILGRANLVEGGGMVENKRNIENNESIEFPYIGKYRKIRYSEEIDKNWSSITINGVESTPKELNIDLDSNIKGDGPYYLNNVTILGWYK